MTAVYLYRFVIVVCVNVARRNAFTVIFWLIIKLLVVRLQIRNLSSIIIYS